MTFAKVLVIATSLVLCFGHVYSNSARKQVENEIKVKENGHDFTNMLCAEADSETCDKEDGQQYIKFVVKNHAKLKLNNFKHLNGICNGDGPIEKKEDLVQSSLTDIPTDYACAVGYRRIRAKQSVSGFCGILTWHLDTSPPTRLVFTYDTKEQDHHHNQFVENYSVRLWSESSDDSSNDLEAIFLQSDRKSKSKIIDVVKTKEGITIQGKMDTVKKGNCLVTIEVSLFDHSGQENNDVEDSGEESSDCGIEENYENIRDGEEDASGSDNVISDVDDDDYDDEMKLPNQAGGSSTTILLAVIITLLGMAAIALVAWTCRNYLKKRRAGSFTRLSTGTKPKKNSKKPYKPKYDENTREPLMTNPV